MSGSSDSNDTSEIFWPGFVDAIANLAINLLFVIAVMCIVILSFVLEETVKGVSPPEKLPGVSAPAIEPATLTAPQELVDELVTENAKLKAEVEALKQLTSQAKKQSAGTAERTASTSEAPEQKLNERAAAQRSATSDTPTKSVKQDVVDVHEDASKVTTPGASSSEAVSAGLIVNFDPKAVTLSPKEAADIGALLPSYGSLTSGRWQVTVITPKGFTEAGRLAYYRAVAVRNVLLQNGVPGTAIDIRVLESAQAGANNARVTVNALP
jgi:outer membrane protein OmpA-like peptidoglycan-associated protein